jgi:amino acid transporter
MSEKRSTFTATVMAVLWSFVGIRKHRDYAHDAEHLKPVHVIVAGLVAGLLFVLGLVLVVRLMVHSVAVS